MTPKCKDCRYWLEGRSNIYQGECRRHAPGVRLLITTSSYRNLSEERDWPKTQHDEWCGDFEAGPQP